MPLSAAERCQRYRDRKRMKANGAAPAPAPAPDGGDELLEDGQRLVSAFTAMALDEHLAPTLRIAAGRVALPFLSARFGIRPVPVDGRKQPDVRILTVPDPADRRDLEAALAELGLLRDFMDRSGVDVPAVLAQLKGSAK